MDSFEFDVEVRETSPKRPDIRFEEAVPTKEQNAWFLRVIACLGHIAEDIEKLLLTIVTCSHNYGDRRLRRRAGRHDLLRDLRRILQDERTGSEGDLIYPPNRSGRSTTQCRVGHAG